MPQKPSPAEDVSIPVLTERLTIVTRAAASPAVVAATLPSAAAAESDLLERLAARLPQAVDGAVAAHLEAAIEGATARLAEQLHEALRAAVRDSVATALAAERERLRRP